MTFDESLEAAKHMLAEQLKRYRGSRRVEDVAESIDIHKDTIYKIEKGGVVSLDTVARMLWEYDNLTLSDFLEGFRLSDVPAKYDEDYRKLKEVLESGITVQIEMVRAALTAAHRTVEEVKAKRYSDQVKKKAHPPPPKRKSPRASSQ